MKIYLLGMFSLLFSCGFLLNANEAKKDERDLIARGEHRIQVINYGHRDPEIPMAIMQANFYNAHHEDYVIRIEDLNDTINQEIDDDVNREYNAWFNAEYNRRRAIEQQYENEQQLENSQSGNSQQLQQGSL